jgi:hypothetical protein
MVESGPTPENPRAPWVVFFGEDYPDHVTRLTTFQVDSITTAISVWSWFQDDYVSLEQWREESSLR